MRAITDRTRVDDLPHRIVSIPHIFASHTGALSNLEALQKGLQCGALAVAVPGSQEY